ncbi:MAG: hypothetical protein JO127_00440 [Caulobacteraceae bacterium]|nr:hypothetical protein [Caulobacteraceae bacterium]
MNLRRLLLVLASITALAVSAGVIVVALAFALYAGVKPYVGQAGGAAVVAAAAALLIAVLGLVVGAAAKPKRRKSEPEGLIERVTEFVREKPILSAAGALAAGLLAITNPRYLGAMARSFVEGREPPPRRRR